MACTGCGGKGGYSSTKVEEQKDGRCGGRKGDGNEGV